MSTTYTVIKDGPATLTQTGQKVELPFSASGIKTNARPVLLYRVNVHPNSGAVTLSVSINGQEVRKTGFSGTNRTFHEVVAADAVNASDNTLTLDVFNVNSGESVSVQDIVLLYKE